MPNLTELEQEANARDSDWYYRIALASILIYLLLQLTSNLERTFAFLKSLNMLSSWTFEFLAEWDTRSGIQNGEATAIVTALAAVIISINVSAIVASLTPPRTESDEHAFYRWLSKMQFLAPVAASAAIAVACTRLGSDTGLGVGLLMVALIAMGASSLNTAAGARRFSVRVRVSNARQEAATASTHLDNLVRKLSGPPQQQWWHKIGSTCSYSFKTFLLVCLILVLETLVQCVSVPGWIYAPQTDTFLGITIASAYAYFANAVTTGPLLFLLAWSRKWSLILDARGHVASGANRNHDVMALRKFIDPSIAVVVIGFIILIGQLSPPPADQLFTSSMLATSCFFYGLILAASYGKGPAVVVPMHALAYLSALKGSRARALRAAERLEAEPVGGPAEDGTGRKVGRRM